MKIASTILALFLVLTWAKPSYASDSREFVMSCTYGVLAGTLVGAATLAFEDKPGDKLYKVARGASLGLYAGILLGIYVVYGVDDGMDDDLPVGQRKLKEPPPFVVNPLLNDQLQFDGAIAQMRVLSF